MTELRDQLELLRETPWKVLLILDACRYDYFFDKVGEETMQVLSPANCTEKWIKKVIPVLKECGVKRYYTANPLVGKHVNARMGEGTAIPIWRPLWSRLTPLSIPGVNPWAVNGWVLHDALWGSVRYPIVVHYLQPHFPAIGTPPMALGQWGGKWTALHLASRKMPRPERLHRAGKLDLGLMQDAYRGNVELVVGAAMHLANELNVDTVITSDHGELLGEKNEDGKVLFGHAKNEKHELLRRVPWLYCKERDEEPVDEKKQMEERLRALGYYE